MKSKEKPLFMSMKVVLLKIQPRTHGYSKRGYRCFGTHDWHSKGRVNAIGAIIDFVFVAVGLFNGSINSDVFYAWLTSTLLPN